MTVPQLVAHRGYPAHYPENTLIGIEAALDAGARFLEVDVQLSGDQQPVLFHDRNLKRLCQQPGAVHQYSLEELQGFQAMDFGRFGYKFAGTPIPTLEAFAALLQRHPQVTAFIEIKRISLKHFGLATVVNRVLQALRPVKNQCAIISYSLEALRAVRNSGWPVLGAVVDHWRDHKLPLVQELRPAYFFFDIRSLPRWGSVKLPGSRLVVFETTDPGAARRAAAKGVELVETFAIGEMQKALGLADDARG